MKVADKDLWWMIADAMGSEQELLTDFSDRLTQAAQWIKNAEAILITAGAGMGVDSGLPDFRGTEGFWRAYPPFRELGFQFADVANESLFYSDPSLAWGFYGHRLHLYRTTVPHRGFAILRSWCERCAGGGFVFTSNVDGQFQRSGFSETRVMECHGSIHHLQPVGRSTGPVWSAETYAVEVDPASFRAQPPLPRRDGALLRPNILMFGDGSWNATRCTEQLRSYQNWLGTVSHSRLVVIELGAGSAIPTVRHEGERLAQSAGAKLIRINPREAECPRGGISLLATAESALHQIDLLLRDQAVG